MFLRIASLAVIALSIPVWGLAETPAPFPSFEAKRVRPPQPGSGNRITIQIEPPQAPVAVADSPAATGDGDVEQPVGRYGWFWEQVSPDLAASGPGRLEQALMVLAGGEPVTAPRLQLMQDIAGAQGISILTASIGTKVSPALILAVIAVESAGQVEAVSAAGAQGLMQLMPETAARFDVSDALAAQQNIQGGVRYLDWLMEEFGGDPMLVLAGYNAGAGSVQSHQGVPPFAETRDYVPLVLAAFQVAKGLCLTPPQLISDGCVFRTMN
ncbi:lytic transglycosylase domain-containing protein [Parasedimentitalea psychrophila]|uniref:Lytic transglycosylase domain-containing protein n=1 Tax=Parasedimentitalea psychrophila TaxID=2997337 RepID=A0A9Y2P7D4_9RHOB|nr:lytic transglycosylase domain-containing protein [Parasedimentitalea psychrophila]WIY25923.1 lytic transglycosylase domain-containing protein [Parasedimentitalea psychrophila]